MKIFLLGLHIQSSVFSFVLEAFFSFVQIENKQPVLLTEWWTPASSPVQSRSGPSFTISFSTPFNLLPTRGNAPPKTLTSQSTTLKLAFRASLLPRMFHFLTLLVFTCYGLTDTDVITHFGSVFSEEFTHVTTRIKFLYFTSHSGCAEKRTRACSLRFRIQWKNLQIIHHQQKKTI